MQGQGQSNAKPSPRSRWSNARSQAIALLSVSSPDSGSGTGGKGGWALTQVRPDVSATRQELREFHYGNKVKTLWSRTSLQECEGSLAAMRSIVEDTTRRLQADFHDKDWYMSLGAMDLSAWVAARSAGGGALAAPQGQRRHPCIATLTQKARRLHEGLGVDFSATTWGSALQQCLRWRAGMLKALPAGRDECGIDNRQVWHRLLAEKKAEFRSLDPIIRFYCSMMDGTGSVERGLGRHAHILGVHVGAPERDEGGSLSEACLEVSIEGPQAESQMFTPGLGNVLLLTPFSRQCAPGAQLAARFSPRPRRWANSAAVSGSIAMSMPFLSIRRPCMCHPISRRCPLSCTACVFSNRSSGTWRVAAAMPPFYADGQSSFCAHCCRSGFARSVT